MALYFGYHITVSTDYSILCLVGCMKIYNYQGVVTEDYNIANTPAPNGTTLYLSLIFFGILLAIYGF